MQGASIPNWDGLPLGEGRARDAWDSMQAAALCAGMQRRHYVAGRVRWMQDWSAAAELESLLWFKVAEVASRENWMLCIGQKTCRFLSELAVAEMLEPAKYGFEHKRVGWFAGQVKLESNRVWPVWERTWRSRYQLAYSIIERWSEIALGHIWKKQQEAEG